MKYQPPEDYKVDIGPFELVVGFVICVVVLGYLVSLVLR
jgi:hypothetical protein